MFSGFGIPWDPNDFAEGAFIRPDDRRYAPVATRLASELDAKCPDDGRRDSVLLGSCFSSLLRYRNDLEGILRHFSGSYEGSGLFLYPRLKTRGIDQAIRDRVAPIDDVLVLLIDPVQRKLPVDVLVKEHGYDDSDLDKVDLDWI